MLEDKWFNRFIFDSEILFLPHFGAFLLVFSWWFFCWKTIQKRACFFFLWYFLFLPNNWMLWVEILHLFVYGYLDAVKVSPSANHWRKRLICIKETLWISQRAKCTFLQFSKWHFFSYYYTFYHTHKHFTNV